ncbi:hypothetical protein DIPPA_15457 [Diplonema papillatum]|nr:hypothetical protein DIPPA_15457 [Diplonema papillatum]
MRQGGHQPTLVSYNIMIGAYASSNDLRSATSLVRALCGDGFRPNDRTLTAVLKAVKSLAEARGVLTLFKDKHAVYPSFTALTMVLRVCENPDELSEVVALAKSRSDGVTDPVFWTGVLLRYSQLGHLPGVRSVFEDILLPELELQRGGAGGTALLASERSVSVAIQAVLREAQGGRISVDDCKRWLDFAERIRKVAPRSVDAGLILDEQLMFLFGACRHPATDAEVRRRAVNLYYSVVDARSLRPTACFSRAYTQAFGVASAPQRPLLQLRSKGSPLPKPAVSRRAPVGRPAAPAAPPVEEKAAPRPPPRRKSIWTL